jgi:RNA polymerase sigma-70 factor (ECF subfamily)
MDDAALLAAVAGGNHAALKDLFDRHAPWVAVRLRRSLPADAVEDVVQETFIAVWRGSARFSRQGEPSAWIWGIARRQAALWMRTAGPAALALDFNASSKTTDLAERAIQGVDLERALETLGREGEPQRELVRMTYFEDRSVSEISERLRIPAGTVKSRLFVARKRLRAALLGEES